MFYTRKPSIKLWNNTTIFSLQYQKLKKNQNNREGVLCAKSTEKRKLQCTAAKCVMWAFAWKIALSCITRSSITEVMTINLLHLYSSMIFVLDL